MRGLGVTVESESMGHRPRHSVVPTRLDSICDKARLESHSLQPRRKREKIECDRNGTRATEDLGLM
jgi:hypothetical protein